MEPHVPQRLTLPGIAWKELVPAIGKRTGQWLDMTASYTECKIREWLLSPLTTQEAVLPS